jgi:glutamyl-Q tRNA(Asp) synthetase
LQLFDDDFARLIVAPFVVYSRRGCRAGRCVVAAHESSVVNAPFVTRFAPSPNGDLHLGHALSAITGFDLARRHGGRFILRIEDIDMQRTREAHVANILEDLRWLGLSWDEPVLRQSTRFDAYKAAAAHLRERGLLYPCFATRTEIENAVAFSPPGVDPDGAPLYPGLCKGIAEDEIERRMAAGEPACLRLDMDRALAAASARLRGSPLTFHEWNGDVAVPPQIVPADPARWGDAIIVRKDTPSSYHLAVVVDDAAQGITHVVRGKDLYEATHLQRLLQVLLDLPEPETYHHHRLMLDPAGRKLSKSLRDRSLRDLREDGASPADIRRLVGL